MIFSGPPPVWVHATKGAWTCIAESSVLKALEKSKNLILGDPPGWLEVQCGRLLTASSTLIWWSERIRWSERILRWVNQGQWVSRNFMLCELSATALQSDGTLECSFFDTGTKHNVFHSTGTCRIPLRIFSSSSHSWRRHTCRLTGLAPWQDEVC